jgi:FG-GAP-like repeat/CARDB/Beta-propeller repeat
MHMKRKRSKISGMMAVFIAAVAALLVAQTSTAATSVWTSQSWTFPALPTGTVWAKPALGDLDGDGLPDLLIGGNTGLVYAYKNTGSPGAPAWLAEPSWSITTPCADTTPSSKATFVAPAIADLNNDGKPDLILGTRDAMCIYQNTAANPANGPVWTRNSAWEITGLTTNQFYIPALADLNNDGKLDVMLGRLAGDVVAYQNIGANPSLGPVWQAAPTWNLFSVGSQSSPALADLDGDGVPDLLVADVYGNVFAFKDTGAADAPQWTSAGNWDIPGPLPNVLHETGISLGHLNGTGTLDLLYSQASGVTSAYEASWPLPPYVAASSPPPSTGTTVAETFDSFACTGSWVPAPGGPNNSYTRDCGNGWTAYAEDAGSTASSSPTPGPVGNANVITLDSSANGPSIVSGVTGSAEMYTAPNDAVRGVLWLLKTFPVTPNVPIKTLQADFRLKLDEQGNLATSQQFYGMVIFDGVVSNPSGQAVSGVPTRADVLASDIHIDNCGKGTWCSWIPSTLGGKVVPTRSMITVAFKVEDNQQGQTSYAELDNLTISGIANVPPVNVPVGDIAQLWKQDYQAGGSFNMAEATDLKVDSAGNLYVVGNSYNGLNYDIVTTKYDASGNQVWQKFYDGGDSDQAVAMALDAQGNINVTGRSYNTATSSDDYVVIKYRPDGSQVWSSPSRYDNAGQDDDPAELATDGAGNVYVTGSTCSDVATTCQYLTVAFSVTDGAPLWNAIYNNGSASQNNKAVAIGLDGAGNVYVTGTSSGSSDDIATVKYSASGSQVWTNRYDSSNNDRAVAMAVDNSGNLYIAGMTYGVGYPAIEVLKYNTDGLNPQGTPGVQWVQTYSGTPEAIPSALTIDGSGNVYVTGEIGLPGNHDFVTIKFMPNGVVAWAQAFGNPGVDDRAISVAVDGQGNVYVAGSLGRSTGNSDFVLLRYDSSGIARSAITYDGYTLTDSPVAIVLGVDSQGDTVPYVTGISADTSGLDHMVTLRYEKALPDLTMTGVSGPSSAMVGGTINVVNTVKNNSDLANKIYAYPGSFTVGLYLSPSVGGFPSPDKILIGSRTVADLAPGASDAATTAVTIPSTYIASDGSTQSVAEGSYFLTAVADSGGVVTEAHEGNNTVFANTSIAIQGVKPDLVVTNVTGPTSVQRGNSYSVSTTIANLASPVANGPFDVGIYLSTDPTITTADTLIGSYTVASLGGLSSATANNTTVTIPDAAHLASGNYYLGAIVDIGNAVDESNEANNSVLMVSGTQNSTLLVNKADFLAGLPGTNVAVVQTATGINVRLAQSVAWTANSAWNQSIASAAYFKPALGDLDGNGLPDLAIGISSGNIQVFLNSGTLASPTWVAAPTSWNITGACSSTLATPALVDVNGDGLLDMVVGTASRVCIYQNTGSKTQPQWTRNTTWEASLAGLPTGRNYAVALADLDGDGKVDLMIGENNATVVGYQNTGTISQPAWTAKTSWNVTGLPSGQWYAPALGDMNGDGVYDLMIGNLTGAVLAYQNIGTSSSSGPIWQANSAWSLADPFPGSNNAAGVALGDLNGDGSVDLLYGAFSGGVYGYQNTGLFSLTPGIYTSKVVNAGTHGGFTNLVYSATATCKTGATYLCVDIRAGNTVTPDGTWTDWFTGIGNGGDISSLGTRQYVQYRVRISTGDTAVSPALSNIEALTNPSPAQAIPVSVMVGSGGGGELGVIDLLLLGLATLLFGGGGRVRGTDWGRHKASQS